MKHPQIESALFFGGVLTISRVAKAYRATMNIKGMDAKSGAGSNSPVGAIENLEKQLGGERTLNAPICSRYFKDKDGDIGEQIEANHLTNRMGEIWRRLKYKNGKTSWMPDRFLTEVFIYNNEIKNKSNINPAQ